MAKNITTPDAATVSDFVSTTNAFKVTVNMNIPGEAQCVAQALAPLARHLGIMVDASLGFDHVKLTPAPFFEAEFLHIGENEAYITNKDKTAFVGFVKGAIVVDVTKSVGFNHMSQGPFFSEAGHAFCSFFMNGLKPETLDIDISHWRNGEGEPLKQNVTIDKSGVRAV